ncbi:hypothetical protein [Hydrogenophaga sp. 2FB]|uniref:hypothetical protein n=1 Tax=Hydrogenophaga sp. 2FB TaxID=2502187 RepID=UPI0010F5C4AD|nr:hypothetical protein [Hydrogenophaga sp. 2FB]
MQGISIELTQAEVDEAAQLLEAHGQVGPYSFSAMRYTPDLGAVTEVVKVAGPVHGEYPRENGGWVQCLRDDLANGLYSSR